MTYTIKSFIASDGERFSLLFDDCDGGFPLFYPTAFISRSIRLCTSPETQKVYLDAIKRVCEWETAGKAKLAARFQKRQFLRSHEIDDLAKHLRAARRGKSGGTISSSKGNTYIAYAAKYLRWLADEVITDANTPDIRAAIDTQERTLNNNVIGRKGSASARTQQILTKQLPDKTREQLLALFDDPFPHLYRPADQAPRLRSIVMLRILYETGMRRGELLSLKLRNFQESAGGPHASLVIERNHHDEFDSRVNQPVAKTEGRILPISDETENLLLKYISTYRAEVPGVGFSDDDFIFVNHRAGRGQGNALSISTFDQVLQNLKHIFPALKPLHPHLLRHDWNYRFSKLADAHHLKPEKERELRELLMGWAENSEMARRYNLRHTQEQSTAFGLMVANDTKRKTSDKTKENQEKATEFALLNV